MYLVKLVWCRDVHPESRHVHLLTVVIEIDAEHASQAGPDHTRLASVLGLLGREGGREVGGGRREGGREGERGGREGEEGKREGGREGGREGEEGEREGGREGEGERMKDCSRVQIL